jgi:hypothetical protein
MTQPLSDPLQTGLRFFHHPLPAGPSVHLAVCFPWLDLLFGPSPFGLCVPGRPSGFPRSVQVPAWVRFRLSAGGSTSAIGDRTAPIPAPLPFWPKPVSPCGACQHLWLVFNDDVYQRFTYVNHTTQSELPTTLMLAVATSPRGFVAIPRDDGYICPQSFAPHRYQ